MLFAQVYLWCLTDAISTRLTTARRRAQTGQGLVEYGLIIALVAVAVVAVVTLFGSSLGQTFSNILSSLNLPGTGKAPTPVPTP